MSYANLKARLQEYISIIVSLWLTIEQTDARGQQPASETYGQEKRKHRAVMG